MMPTRRDPTVARRFTPFASLCLALLGSTACGDASGTARTGVGSTVWRVEAGIQTPYEWFGRPAVSNGRVFMDVGNSIKAFDTQTGAELWSTVVRSHLAPESTNLVVQNGLVLVSDPLAVVALDETTGTTRWSVAPNDSTVQSFGAADEHSFYTGTRGAFVFALELATGATRWEKSLRQSDWLGGNIIGIARSGDTLAISGVYRTDPTTSVPRAFAVVLDSRDGRELWRYQSDTGLHAVYAAPAISDDVVLLGDGLQRTMTGYDRSTGEVRWVIHTDPEWGGPNAQPFVQNGIVYFGAYDNHVYSADLKTGRVRWRANLGSGVEHVVRCGKYVFANSQGATIFEAATGRRVRDVVIGDIDFLSSEFAVSENRAFASGTRAVYALSCE